VSQPRILIACIGNIFLGDDAFGVEVASRLAHRPLPSAVRLVDFGIRGFDLVHALADPYEAIVLVDALPRGGEPGTVYLVEPDPAELEAPADALTIDGHGMDPLRVLRLARAMGARPKQVLLVGCEPTPLTDEELEEGSMGLSEPVRAALDDALHLVECLVERLSGEVVIAS
jgi:hydrogenase maturation protease